MTEGRLERSTLHQRGRAMLIYGAAVVMQRAVSIVMLPIYTRFLTPTDYGVAQMLDMTADVATILLVAGTAAGLQRNYIGTSDPARRRAIVSTTMLAMLGQGVLGALLLGLLAAPIWHQVLEPAGSVNMVRLSGANFALGLLSAVPLLLLQSEQRAVPFALTILARLALQLSLNVLFVVHFEMQVWGILWSSFIANLVVGSIAAVWCASRVGLHFDMEIARQLTRFGAPYRIANLGTFIMSFGDRYVLEETHGLATVGIYALAYQFGFVLGQVGHVPMSDAWEPQRFHAAAAGEEALKHDATHGFLFYNLVLLTCAVALVAGASPMLRLLAGPSFQGAAPLVPVIVVAYVFNAWTLVVKFAIDLSGKTRPVAVATWISVAITCAAYALLIPAYGSWGAAWATLVGFVARFALVFAAAQRVRPLPYGWARISHMAIAAGVWVVVATVVRPAGFAADTSLAVGELVAFGLYVWLVILRPIERGSVLKPLRERLASLRARLA